MARKFISHRFDVKIVYQIISGQYKITLVKRFLKVMDFFFAVVANFIRAIIKKILEISLVKYFIQ